jgi:SAM-dependent methyltransferase
VWSSGPRARRFPGLPRLTPTHSQVRYAQALRRELPPGGRWLELGCGRQIVPGWALGRDDQQALVASASLVVGVDLDPAIREHDLIRHKVMASGYALPFRDGALDVVTANMVMEHVERPVALLSEIARVLRPGGRLIFHTPNRRHPAVSAARLVPERAKKRLVWWLERRRESDVFETYYRLNRNADIEAGARAAGFTVALLRSWGSVGVFSGVPILRRLELPLVWLLEHEPFRAWRSNLFVMLIKPEELRSGAAAR